MRTSRTTKGRAGRPQTAPTPMEPAVLDFRPTVIVAPGVLGKGAVVVRHPDDTDSEYQARCELFALLLEHSEKQ
jgi:hypothetical protein